MADDRLRLGSRSALPLATVPTEQASPPLADPTTALIAPHELRFPRYRLVVVDGPDRGRTIEGGADDLSIGTEPGNDLVLGDATVSRHHVAIAPGPRGQLLRDLGSTNGTTVDGVRIESAYLAPGVTIAIGTTRLVFETLGDETCPQVTPDVRWGPVLGASSAMRRIFAILPRLAESDSTLLLEGETGTGKGLLAQAIHEASTRAAGPFVVIDCGSIPPTLIESELFGHEKGAFTGAASSRTGAFEAARGGTVFLDEIGELPLDMQPKLLRALEERTVKRIGGNELVRLDVRIIAATNRDLRSEINRGRFRPDLYYRLNTFHLRIPPLRERREDIAALVAHFYTQLSPDALAPPAELILELARHDWPGNVRELRAAIERIVLLGDPAVWRAIADPSQPTGEQSTRETSFREAKERAIATWERDYLRELMARNEHNVSRAARDVRMDRNHLRELLRRHGLAGPKEH